MAKAVEQLLEPGDVVDTLVKTIAVYSGPDSSEPTMKHDGFIKNAMVIAVSQPGDDYFMVLITGPGVFGWVPDWCLIKEIT